MSIFRLLAHIGTTVSEVLIYGILIIVYIVFLGFARLLTIWKHDVANPIWQEGEKDESYTSAY